MRVSAASGPASVTRTTEAVHRSALALPDPAPAPGNGTAFGKFLSIYNELRGVATPTVDATA